MQTFSKTAPRRKGLGLTRGICDPRRTEDSRVDDQSSRAAASGKLIKESCCRPAGSFGDVRPVRVKGLLFGCYGAERPGALERGTWPSMATSSV